jgi:hypothetical protein
MTLPAGKDLEVVEAVRRFAYREMRLEQRRPEEQDGPG